MTEAEKPPLLRMHGIRKAFPGVLALDDVDLDLQTGEVLALLGENGAGKSTLIKVIGGAHLPDEGTIEIDGQSVRIETPQDSLCLLYTSPSPRDATLSRMPSSA